MKQYKVFVVANLVFGILLIAFAQVILPVCCSMGGASMRCGTPASIETALGFALLLVAVVAILGYSNKGESLLNIARSACHSVTGPVFALTGVVIALFAALNLVYLKLRRRDEQD